MVVAFLLLCFSGLILFQSASFLHITEVRQAALYAKYAWEEVKNQNEEKALFSKSLEIVEKIRNVVEEIDSAEWEVLEILGAWAERNDLDIQEKAFYLLKKPIGETYSQWVYQLKKNCVDCLTTLTDQIIINSSKNTISFIISENEEFHYVNTLNIIHNILQKNAHGSIYCSLPFFPQQIIHGFYQFAMVTEIKNYLLTTFAYIHKQMLGQENYEEKIAEITRNYTDEINLLALNFQRRIRHAPKTLWKCDPQGHVLGKTYEQLTKLIEGYIVNEQNLSSDGKCFQGCSDFKYVTNSKCRGHSWCEKQPTCQRILDCTPTDSSLTVCYNDHGFAKRRYEFVSFNKKGKVLGANSGKSCRKHDLLVFTKYVFWNCEYCFCRCDHPGYMSDRFINLRAALADFKNNKVVTGIRFVKHNRVIHLQVQEGKLLPFAKIDANSLRWVPVDGYRITGRHVYEGQDFHTFTYEERRMDLGDVVADPGHAITGVRFMRMNGHVRLQILQAPFDFATGQLHWHEHSFKDDGRLKIGKPVWLFRPDDPVKIGLHSIPNFGSGQFEDHFIEFTHSDVEKDAAQTTVPFFDTQPVESSQPTVLSGIGIFHKGQWESGGFIAPKIIAFDVSEYLQLIF